MVFTLPSHKVHRQLDKLLFKKTYSEVHRAIDSPTHYTTKLIQKKTPSFKVNPKIERQLDLILFQILRAKGHRTFGHDPVSAMVISEMVCGDVLPGLLHILADRTFKEPSRRRRVK